MLKKLIASILLVIFALTTFATQVKADTWYNQDPINWYKKVYDTTISPESEIFGERYTAAQVQWIFYSILSLPLNVVGASDTLACALNGDVACIGEFFGEVGSSLTTFAPSSRESNGIADFIFNTDRPLSGISFFRNTLRNLEIIPEANAQAVGFGFNALEPIREVWQGFRNISYSLLILATLVLAFMIMFRVKLSPQVVITAQSAIPKLVTAIVLITFSYAIAGFLVDLMYVVIGIVSIALASLPYTIDSPQVHFTFMTVGPGIGQFGLGLLGHFIIYYIGFILTSIIVMISFLGAILSVALSPLLALLLLLLIAIGGLLVWWLLFKTFFMLLKSFANILLLTIFAPLQFLAGTVVGSLGFSSWIRSFVSHLSVFVVVGVFFELSFFFLVYAARLALGEGWDEDIFQLFFQGAFGSGINNLITSESAGWPPLLSGGSQIGLAFLMLGVSYVMISLIPKTAEVIQGFISGRPFAYGSAVGESIGEPGRIAGGLAMTGVKLRPEFDRLFGGRARTPEPTAPLPTDVQQRVRTYAQRDSGGE